MLVLLKLILTRTDHCIHLCYFQHKTLLQTWRARAFQDVDRGTC